MNTTLTLLLILASAPEPSYLKVDIDANVPTALFAIDEDGTEVRLPIGSVIRFWGSKGPMKLEIRSVDHNRHVVHPFEVELCPGFLVSGSYRIRAREALILECSVRHCTLVL